MPVKIWKSKRRTVVSSLSRAVETLEPRQLLTASLLADLAESTSLISGGGTNSVVFSGTSTGTGREVFVSDGTSAGTGVLVDLTTGTGSSVIPRIAVEGTTVFYFAKVNGGNDGVFYYNTRTKRGGRVENLTDVADPAILPGAVAAS